MISIANCKLDQKAYTFNPYGFNGYNIHKTTGTIYDMRGHTVDYYYQNFDLATSICLSNGTKYDAEGYDINGLDEYLFDREGFYNHTHARRDPEGFHADGYNRYGFNREGIHRNGTRYNDEGYDQEGYDQEGYNRRGFNREGIHKNGTRYNKGGYDQDGYYLDGYNFYGFNREGVHRNGTRYNDEGFDRDGYDQEGYNRRGFNREGIHRNGTHFNNPGYDFYGKKMVRGCEETTDGEFDQDGIDEFGFNRRGIHIGQTSVTGEICYVDADGFNSQGYSTINGKHRITGEIDRIFVCMTKYLDENSSAFVDYFARENGYGPRDVRLIFRQAEKLYPILNEKVKEKRRLSQKIASKLILDDVDRVINKEITIKDFWGKHPRLSFGDVLKVIYDKETSYHFVCRVLDNISDTTSSNDMIFALCGKYYELCEAMDSVDLIRKKINSVSVSTYKEKAIKKVALVRCSEAKKRLSRLSVRDMSQIRNMKETFSDGKEIIYTSELIENAIQSLKADGEYICTFTVMNLIRRANS